MQFRTYLLAIFLLFLGQMFGQSENSVVLESDGPGPAVLLDGREITQGQLAALPTGEIGDIRILDGKIAKQQYGKYVDHGVIVVTSASRLKSMPAPAEKELVTPREVQIRQTVDQDFQGYVLIDGKMSDAAAFKALQPEQILSMEVYKGSEALARFGDKAEKGAIVIKTKQ